MSSSRHKKKNISEGEIQLRHPNRVMFRPHRRDFFWGASWVVPHLHIKVPAHSVDADAMEPAVRQVVEGGAEHVGVPVRL